MSAHQHGLMTVEASLGPQSTNTTTYLLHINGKLAFVASIFADNSGEHAKRMADCWNALSDLSQDALDGGWTRAGLEAYGNRMKSQRDELLAALRYIVGCSAPMTDQQEQCWDVMRSAIAKATVEPQ